MDWQTIALGVCMGLVFFCAVTTVLFALLAAVNAIALERERKKNGR